MGPQDLKQIAIGFLVVLVLVTLAVLFPVYRIQEPGRSEVKYVRYPIWNPPTTPVGHHYKNIASAELERMMQEDPRFADMVERWEATPREIARRPIIFPNRYSDERNLLGMVAFYSLLGYGAFVVFKFVNRG